MWLRLIVEVVVLALVLVSVTSIVRALAPKSWRERKPISCDVCMTFWLVLGTSGGLWYLERGRTVTLAATALAAHGLALLLLSRFKAPELPPIEGLEAHAGVTPTQEGGSWPVGGALQGEQK